jgi:hypothetical protein
MKDDSGRYIVDEDTMEWIEQMQRQWQEREAKALGQAEVWRAIAGILIMVYILQLLPY